MLTTLQQAKKLKELGYGLTFTAFRYEKSTEDVYNSYDPLIQCQSGDLFIKAPTVSEALDWFREEKGIVAEIKVSKYTKPLEYMFRIYEYCADLRSYESHSHKLGFSTHPLAESALLDEIIKYLEK